MSAGHYIYSKKSLSLCKNNHNFDSEFMVKAETAKNFLCPADITRYSPKKNLLTCVVGGGVVAPKSRVGGKDENGIFASNIRVLGIFFNPIIRVLFEKPI